MDEQSSYHKIYVALTKTETWKELCEKVELRLSNATITQQKFVCIDWDDRPFLRAKFTISFGNGDTNTEWETRNEADPIGHESVSNSCLWRTSELKSVVTNHYGKAGDVKTRNCKFSVIENGSYKNDTDSWLTWASRKLTNTYYERIKDLTFKLRASCKKVMDSPEFAVAKREAEIQACKDQISATMLHWRHMPDDVLKEAWNQFIAADLMEE